MSLLAGYDDSGRTNRIVGALLGAVLVLLGAAGIAVSLGHPFAGSGSPHAAKVLSSLSTDLLQSLVNVGLGLLVVAAAVAGTHRSRGANRLVGAVVLLIGVYGIAALDTRLDVFATNDKSTDVHLLLGFLLLVPAVLADRRRSHGQGPKYRSVSHDGAGGGTAAGRTPPGGRRG